MNPDQTGELSDLGPYSLQYRLSENKQTTKVVTGEKKFNSLARKHFL